MSLTLDTALPTTALADTYLTALIAGDRGRVRKLIDAATDAGLTARELMTDLCWDSMESLQAAYKEDRISLSAMNMATRLNRSTVDRLAHDLPREDSIGRSALIFCGDAEPEELGGQICADLFESAGWTVRFAGGGVPNDEVLEMIGRHRPDLTVMFATRSNGVPAVRKLIDYLRDVNACPTMQVMCAGGIYKRAEGLAEEIGADLYAADAAEAVAIATQFPRRRATVDQQTVGRTRRLRKAAANRAPVLGEVSDEAVSGKIGPSAADPAEMPRLRAA